jgi:hypothetical protein
MPFTPAEVLARPCESSGMKKYIRQMFDDLNNRRDKKNPIPPVMPQDLENQNLSPNPEERVKQLDQQAQDDEIRETLE